MTNHSQKLMHHFDDPPSQLNPEGLDSSFTMDTNFNNFILSPITESNTAIQSQQQQPLKMRNVIEKSFIFNLRHRSSKVIPDSISSTNFISSKKKIPHVIETIKKDKLFPIKQEENPFNEKFQVDRGFSKNSKQEIDLRDGVLIAQMDELITSPMGRLTSGTESFLNVQLIEKKNRNNPLVVYYLVRRFMTKISIKRRQKLFFQAKHFDIVNDKASENNLTLTELHQNNGKNNSLICWFGGKHYRQFVNQYVRFRNRLITNLGKLIKHIPLIYPQAMGKIIWDTILCIVLMYFFVMIPIEICFENDILLVEYPLTVLFIVFLLCDYFLKMNTVYYEYGKPITDRVKIFQQYVKNGLLIDGLSITVLLISIFSGTKNPQLLNFILLMFYTQFHYFRKIIKHAEESLNLSKVVQSIFNLVKLVFTILFVEHIFSCLWYYIAVFKQRQNKMNWLAASHLLDESWEIQYLVSFYFSTVTMLSVGYGDIVPTNSLERVICIFFMLFACMQLSYSVNTVGQIINSLSQSEDEGKGKMRIINKYMNENAVSFGLQYEVREYLKIYWQQQVVQESQEEEKIIINLSEGLRNKLIFEANNSILRSCPLFQKHFSEDTKFKLLKVMKQVVITPETVITSQINSINEPCLCFVQLGELDVCMNQQSQVGIGSFSKGMHFGLEDFITGQTPHIQLSSQAFVKLIIITRSDFLKEIIEHPNDYEEFCMIKDQYMFQTIVTSDKCNSCQCTGHDIFNCPLVHFVIDREKIIKSYQFDQKQISRNFHRSSKRQKNQFSALIDQWAIQEISQILQNQEEEICYYYDKVNNIYQQTIEQTTRPSFIEIDRSSIKPLQHKQISKSVITNGNPVGVTSLMKKFQNVVKGVMHMLIIPNAKKYAANHSAFTKQRSEVQKFNTNLYNQFKKLKNQEGDFLHHKSLKQKELDEIHFLILKMNLIHIQDYCQLILFSTRFESQKYFLMYSPHNNLDKVIEIYDKSESTSMVRHWFNQDPSSKSTTLRQNILRVSLTNYMLFPYDYFKKFCKQENKLTYKSKTSKLKNARLLFQKFKKKNQAQRMKLKHLTSTIRPMPLATSVQGGTLIL